MEFEDVAKFFKAAPEIRPSARNWNRLVKICDTAPETVLDFCPTMRKRLHRGTQP